MVRRLFLTGPALCGKSGLIEDCLGARLAEAGGYVIRRSFGERGELVGFTLAPAAAAAGIAGLEGEGFLDCTQFPPRQDNEVFRHTAARLLREALWYPYALLDEIGGCELLVPQYRDALDALLRSSLPVVGVLKPEEDCEALRRALGLGEKFSQQSRRLRHFLEQDEETRIVPMEAPEDREPRLAVSAWAEAWLR